MQDRSFRNRRGFGGSEIALLASIVLVGGLAVTGAANGTDCVDCQRMGSNLDGEMLAGADFTGANYYKASFVKANLAGTNFTNADLTRANFTGANLTNALLFGADMTGAKLKLAITKGARTGATTRCPDGTAGPCSF